MADALKTVVTRKVPTTTPQTKKAVKGQKKNHQGGYTFVVGDLERVKRFLIMGSEDSFYQSGARLSLENAKTIQKIASSADAGKVQELIDLIVDVSVGGRAVKQQPGLFALALTIATTEIPDMKNYGYSKVAEVARTGTTLFQFAGYLNQFQRFGMGARKAIARWYTEKNLDSLAYQMVKYQAREGWSHADLIALSHPRRSKDDVEFSNLINWALDKPEAADIEMLPKVVQGFELAKAADAKKIPALVREFGLSWEMIPSESLNDVKVWEPLLKGNVPLGALLRQLPRLTRIGVISPLGGLTEDIVARLTDQNALIKARIHPLQILVAQATYASGHSQQGSSTWTPVQRIVDALDKAFYLAFKAVEPTGKRWLLALDLSASMTWNKVGGLFITPREASAALSLVTAATEKESLIVGFTGGGWRSGDISDYCKPLTISPQQRLDDVIRNIERQTAGGTDCAAPMIYALENNIKVDAFVVYTDNETGHGRIHPHEALEKYRKATGINAKLIVVGMTATKFTIANPNDPGMLDIAGFDTAAPGLMAEFVKDL